MGSSQSSDSPTSVVAKESVMVNVVTPYQLVHFTLTNTLLRIEWPVSILGVVPIRHTQLQVQLSELHSIHMAHTVIPIRLIVVAVLASLPFLFDLPPYLIGGISALAVWFLLLAVVGAVKVQHAGGRSTIPVCLLQRRASQRFIEQVWGAAGRDGTDHP